MYRRPLPRPRRRIDQNGGLWIDGEFFMGRYRAPPMPPRIALTDRVTGEIKVLSHTAGAGAIELVDVNPRWPDVHIYGVNGEPWYFDGTTHWRIYLSNGTIHAGQSSTAGSSARILTRRGYDTTVLEITADAAGSVVYTQVEL